VYFSCLTKKILLRNVGHGVGNGLDTVIGHHEYVYAVASIFRRLHCWGSDTKVTHQNKTLFVSGSLLIVATPHVKTPFTETPSNKTPDNKTPQIKTLNI